jgi:Leucine-rich repeat (LRR) protein
MMNQDANTDYSIMMTPMAKYLTDTPGARAVCKTLRDDVPVEKTKMTLDMDRYDAEKFKNMRFPNVGELTIHKWEEYITPLSTILRHFDTDKLQFLVLREGAHAHNVSDDDDDDDDDVSVISVLASCTQLTRLDLKGCTHVRDISALASCTKLVSLDLTDTGMDDISPLAKCTALTSLHTVTYTDAGGFDISPLASCTQLAELTIGSWVFDISVFASLTQLTRLDMTDYVAEDLSPLSYLTQLTWLDLSGPSGIAHGSNDISALAKCTKLTSLNLEYSEVDDISALASCTLLTSLNLDGTAYHGRTAIDRALKRDD